ncbi:uncharacterized protein LOC122088175 [Macadamia integrifolia]|uniref:uncharacterized protein LOC122088175 n=1 Tax=Macadamia integrifolia TaxID=60698 RepID=UPI001C4F0B77|nr:uncharacterized protein LOC122088175 [Macadamia integrifolia]
MEIKGTFVPQFRVPLSRVNRVVVKRTKRYPLIRLVKISTSFGETFPESYHRLEPIKVHCNNNSRGIQQSSFTKNEGGNSPQKKKSEGGKLPELSFVRVQPNDQDSRGPPKRAFGQFVARGAVLNEEYWTAAWLRAEANWESLSYMRHVESYKRKYAEQEFYALKQRCAGRDGNSLKCFCIVTVKKEEKNVRRTVLNSVVGTLDISIRQLLLGESYPGEFKKSSASVAGHEVYDAQKYAYVANVSVSKFARRQGIASNMLYLATDIASTAGMKQLYVHVNADNTPAQELYRKIGFEVVKAGSSPLSKDQRLLMCMELHFHCLFGDEISPIRCL